MNKSYFTILISLLILTSCKDSKKTTEAEIPVFSDKIASVVSQVTVGNISSTQAIEVDFIDDIVDYESIDKDLGSDIISLDPEIEGSLVWSDRNTLSFKPTDRWELRERYAVSINLNALSSDFLEKDLGELEFGFYVEGREISEFSAEPKLKDRNDPRIVNYTGSISFTEAVELETLKKAVSLKQGGKSFLVNFKPENGNKVFHFESEDLIRDKKSKTYAFIVDDSKLELSGEHRDNFELPAIADMKVTKVQADHSGRVPRLRITFSDDLETTQALDAYVQIEPQTDIKLNRLGNSILVDGTFKFGQSYTLHIGEGVKSRWATTLKSSYKEEIRFNDLPPQIEFSSSGFILPTSNKMKIQFMAANVGRVHLQVKKVYEKNIDEFARNEQLKSDKKRASDFSNSSYHGAVGVILINETLELGDIKNEWLLNEFDLSRLFSEFDNGLYLIQLNFNPKDVLVDVNEEMMDYIQENGQIYKPLVISDIGLTLKRAGNFYHAYTTDLKTGKVLPGVRVKFRNYWYDANRGSGTTNSKGTVKIPNSHGLHYVIAEKDEQITLLKTDEMEWNTSGFDISGISENQQGINLYTYTERGVYRPGDEINLSVIARDRNNTYQDNVPIKLILENPQGLKVDEQLNNKAKNGFYNFTISTEESDPTGNWQAIIETGNRRFYHPLKIETVVPFKLKVRVNSDKDKLYSSDEHLKIDLQSNYLFGTPAAGLKAEAEIEFVARRLNFPKYESFTFHNDFESFTPVTRKIFTGSLDTAGNASINYKLPAFDNVPSALMARVNATIFEKGGRPNNAWLNLPMESYPAYVGIKKAEYGYHYVQIGKELSLPVMVVNDEGIPAEDQTIQYRIYQNSSRWWWEYNSRGDYRRRFKTNNSTVLLKEGKITSGKNSVAIKFNPKERGDYMVEVQVGAYAGHKVSTFLYAYPWGEVPGGDQNEGTLSLRSDKGKYFIGDIAKIVCPMPSEGSALLTIERGEEILGSQWIPNNGSGETVVNIPITEKMVPTSYISVSVIQPHAQSVNDRPIRMFGILPLSVEDPKTRHGLIIKMADELKPNKDFEIEVNTDDGKPTQFTIAVVDEGLLDLTAYKTPNPWKHFFQKLRLQVQTYDIFSHVIGANHDDVFKTFSIGGGMDYRESELGAKKGKRRFKPVSMFQGPIHTDASGKAKVKFTMPEYNGSVRVMVIATRDHSYAREEKTIPVRTDLMVQTSIPRVLGPGEKFKFPASVFAMRDNVGSVDLKISVEGPLKIVGKKSAQLTFTKSTDKDVIFMLQTTEAAGQAKVVVEAKSSKVNARSQTDVMVQPRSTRVYEGEEKGIKKGEPLLIKIPQLGIEGTNHAKVQISLFPNMDFSNRLHWLIRYPYGCIEQTTSSVFPQLYLKEMIDAETLSENQIDENINAGVQRLRLFQTYEGGMGYWPGNQQVSEWGTNYAAHFLVVAKKKGYHVPDDLYSRLVKYMERKARTNTGDLITRVNRVYVLALAGKTSSDLNVLQEKELSKLNDPQKQMLATAFYVLGQKAATEKIANKSGSVVKEYSEMGGSYGSGLRDMGIILNCYALRKDLENAELIAKELARRLAKKTWYSTQSIGYCLFALGNYFESAGIDGTANQLYVGSVKYADGSVKSFESKKSVTINLKKAIGSQVEITLDDESTIINAYANLSYDGVPLRDSREPMQKNISLKSRWLSEEGNEINPKTLKQGTTIYGHFTLENTSVVPHIDEIALVQILPSGWEIENTRLSGSSLPEWTSSMKLGNEEYLDIRDDRIMWFFDMGKGQNYDFLVKVNAVTAGEFYMPAPKAEAMYNNDFQAVGSSMEVIVRQF